MSELLIALSLLPFIGIFIKLWDFIEETYADFLDNNHKK